MGLVPLFNVRRLASPFPLFQILLFFAVGFTGLLCLTPIRPLITIVSGAGIPFLAWAAYDQVQNGKEWQAHQNDMEARLEKFVEMKTNLMKIREFLLEKLVSAWQKRMVDGTAVASCPQQSTTVCPKPTKCDEGTDRRGGYVMSSTNFKFDHYPSSS